MKTDSTKSSKQPGGRWTFEPVIAIVLSILLTIALRLLGEKAWPYLTTVWGLWWFTAVATLVVSSIGVGLFFFKKRCQAMYGISEVGVAVGIILINVARTEEVPNLTSMIAIVGGAYLIVRGLTNFEDGKKKRLLKDSHV